MGANLILPAGSAAAASTTADPVTRSLRFESGATHRLTKTFGSAPSSNKVSTLAFWVKRSKLGSNQDIISANGTSHSENTNTFYVRFKSDDTLTVYSYPDPASNTWSKTTSRKFRDVGAWTHIAILINTDESAAADRLKIYINGVREPSANLSGTDPSSGATNHLLGKATTTFYGSGNVNVQHCIGDEADRFRYKYSGYLADFYFVDGSAIEPDTNFIESTGYSSYKPKAFDMSSYSGNSFHIDAQPAHDAELLISSIARNNGDTTFVDTAKGHTVTKYGNTKHSATVAAPNNSSDTSISFDGTGDYLSVATSSDFDFGSGSYTYEGWFYFNGFSETPDGIFSRNNSSTQEWAVCTNSSGTLQFFESVNNSYNTSSFTFSTRQWYHIALCKNGTTYKVYVDGSEKISVTLSSPPDANLPLIIGRFYDNYDGYYLDGYCFDFRAQKGVDTGGSVPTAAFELNPVYIGGDQSGNKNHFTATNISSHDAMLDTPTKNYATWDAVQKDGGSILSEGNLKTSSVASNNYHPVQATMNLPSGTGWYAEFYVVSNDGVHSPIIGIQDASRNSSTLENIYVTKGVALRRDGVILRDNSSVRTGLGATSNGDIIMVAYKDRKIWFGRNGTWFHSGDPANDSNESTTANAEISGYHFAINAFVNGQTVANFGQDPTFAGNKTSGQDTSQSEFYYAPPTGFKSLNTSNFDDPTVKAHENFGVVTYSGTGSSTTVSTDFQPDLVWVKRRNSSSNHVLTDSVRGANKALNSNTTSTEDSSTSLITAFNSTSFGVGTDSKVNASGGTYVGWHWKESASAGFDIVTYEGNSDTSGDTQSISHSLGVAPEMIIVKARDGRAANDYYARDMWYVWHKDLSSGSSLYLNDTSAAVDYSSGYTSAPISNVGASTFTVCNAEEYYNSYTDFLNWGDPYGYYTGDNERYVAYLFSSVDGVSKVGSYTGNGSSDGSFIYTGFRPAFVMVKPIETAYSWYIHDTARSPYNYSDLELTANSSGAEYSVSGASAGERLDFLSNGFKHRTSNVAMNQSGYKYAYLAFSESPLKYANGK